MYKVCLKNKKIACKTSVRKILTLKIIDYNTYTNEKIVKSENC